MYKFKYKFARLIVRIHRFFTSKGSFGWYNCNFLLEDIYEEEYKEMICIGFNLVQRIP